MELNRKAILFTFISIMIAGLLSAMYSTYQITPLDHNVDLERMRITSTNQLVENVMSYAEISLKISGYKALQEMIAYINEIELFYNNKQDINNTFKESVTIGKVKGNVRPDLEDFTINALMLQIKQITQKEYNISLDYNISNVWIDQKNPFSVIAYMNISITIRNKNMIWNITEIKSTDITIEGLDDPIYFFMGKTGYYTIDYIPTFKKSKTLARKFNITDLERFTNNSEYIVSPYRVNISFVGYFLPLSFFGRLTNDTSVKNESSLTLLSIVNPKEMGGALPVNESYVDFMMNRTEFEWSSCTNLKKIKDFSVLGDSPVIDRNHLTLVFNITDTVEDLEDVNC